jgi:hypothetical protein
LDEVCERFFSLPNKGQQGDLLGNFVLFAVTQHLREKDPGRAYYGLAAEFLRKLTGGSKATAQSVKIRVHKLNRSRNESDELLSFVKGQYNRLKAIGECARQIAPD